MTMTIDERKQQLLSNAARALVANCDHPAIFGGGYIDRDGKAHNPRGLQLARWPESGQFTRRRASYLVGIISILPGLDAARAKAALEKERCAALIQLLNSVGWQAPDGQFPEVSLGNDGALSVTAPWPADLQSGDAPLDSLIGVQPALHRGRFIVGPDTTGDIVTLQFGPAKTDRHIVHHALIAGTSGSGKTWFMLSLAWQLSHHKDAKIIIIDCKGGDGIGFLRNIPGQVGPTIVDDIDGAKSALLWVVQELQRRYRVMETSSMRECNEPPVYVFISEFTRLTADVIGASDPAAIFMLAYLAQMGRAGNVHLIIDTQYPKGSVFGDQVTRKQFDLTMCFRTADQYDTLAVLPPGVDVRPYLTLTQPGDGYTFVESRGRRTLSAYVREADLRDLRDSAVPQLRAWERFDATALEGFEEPAKRGRPAEPFTAVQIAAALYQQRHPVRGDRREALRRALESQTGSGMSSDRLHELMNLAIELNAELDASDYCGNSAAGNSRVCDLGVQGAQNGTLNTYELNGGEEEL